MEIRGDVMPDQSVPVIGAEVASDEAKLRRKALGGQIVLRDHHHDLWEHEVDEAVVENGVARFCGQAVSPDER